MIRARRWFTFAPAVVVLAVAVALTASGCNRAPDTKPVATEPTPPQPALPHDIETQIHSFCGTACHAYPPADSFPRSHWRSEVERAFGFFDKSGLALVPPKLAHVIRYYEERAPEDYKLANVTPTTRPLGVKFETLTYAPPTGGRPMVSHVSAVKLPANGATDAATLAREPVTLLACDMMSGRILALRPTDATPTWKVLANVPNPAHAEVLDFDGDGVLDILVANLGSFPPTDRKCGSVVWLRGKKDGTYDSVTLLSDVGRVADVRAADFRGTGKLDLVVAVFGLHAVGEVMYLENQTTDWSKPVFASRVLDPRHGAIHVPVVDLNNDGKPDFVALIAQEHETIVGFINDGKGNFRKQTLYNAPHPGWGSSGIQMIDMNGDGKLDILYTNGDILDEPYLWKPYHGVQWLENKGDLKFEHRRIADMYGVHNAFAANITGGKLPDVVAVSFLPEDKFPDRRARKADAIVLFEQVAPGQFERHVLASGSCDAVVCLAADLYGTGRADIAVGNFSSPTTDHPVSIWKNLGKK
jgi:hypothetical protein